MSEADIIRYVGKNPTTHRTEIAREFNISYWRARYVLESLVMRNVLDKIVEYPRPGMRRVCYKVSRHRVGKVMAFRFYWDAVRDIWLTESEWAGYRELIGKPERHVEFIVYVDKPRVVEIYPKYVINYLIDYSGWTFSYGGYRARMLKPGEVFRGSKYWKEGDMPEETSKYERCELEVDIRYIDYNYRDNSFHRILKVSNALEYPLDVVKRALVGEILRVCREEFEWGTA